MLKHRTPSSPMPIDPSATSNLVTLFCSGVLHCEKTQALVTLDWTVSHQPLYRLLLDRETPVTRQDALPLWQSLRSAKYSSPRGDPPSWTNLRLLSSSGNCALPRYSQPRRSKVPELQIGCDLQSIGEAILLVIHALGPLSTMRIRQIFCHTVPIKLLAGTNIFLTHPGLWKRLPIICRIPFNQIFSTDFGGSTVLQNFASPFLLLKVVPRLSPLFLG